MSNNPLRFEFQNHPLCKYFYMVCHKGVSARRIYANQILSWLAYRGTPLHPNEAEFLDDYWKRTYSTALVKDDPDKNLQDFTKMVFAYRGW